MRCPICPAARDLELDELLDHVLSRHPKEAIGMMREILHDQVVETTDVVFHEPKAPEEAGSDGPGS